MKPLPSDGALLRRLATGYVPVLAAAVAFLVMAVAVAPVSRQEQAVAATGPGGVQIQNGQVVRPAVTAPGATAATVAGQPAATGGPGAAPVPGQPGAPPIVGPCDGRTVQVTGDPYSPPCIAFAGDNGGATSRGVTNDSITISVRELEGPSAAEIFSQLTGENVSDSPDAYENTVRAYADYFSNRFQFYGRKLNVVFFKGQGVGASELLGGGREQALADAIQASQEIGSFADISGITIPYADALARQGVVNIGAPYPSSQWFQDRAPYAWSLFPDGTNAADSSATWIINRLASSPAVQYSGPAYMGQPRKYAIVAPENPEYQESVNRYLDRLGQAGIPVAMNLKYKLDLSTMVTQASGIVAQLKDAGVTSVICACDPVMLALGMTPKSNEQGYEPEWLTSGLAFVDQDIVGQLIDPRQWQRAFGIAYNAESEPIVGSFPYEAYKSVRPTDEPAFGYAEIYYQFYLLAIGIEMAGPNLTPDSFQAGMFAYPGGSGPRGTWHFGPGDFTPTDDVREIWWDPNSISPQNNKPGMWRQLNDGQRYTRGEVPVGPAPYFQ